MSRRLKRRIIAGLALSAGLTFLPGAHAAPARRNLGERDPIVQIERFVRNLFRPFADLLSTFQMDTTGNQGGPPPPGQCPGDPPQGQTQEGAGIDPHGNPPPGGSRP